MPDLQSQTIQGSQGLLDAVKTELIMEVITWVLGILAVLVFTRQVLIRLGIVLGIIDTGPSPEEMAARRPKTLAEAMRGAMIADMFIKDLAGEGPIMKNSHIMGHR